MPTKSPLPAKTFSKQGKHKKSTGEIKNYTLPNAKTTCVSYLSKTGYVNRNRILRQKL
jgi:hypothetical protein